MNAMSATEQKRIPQLTLGWRLHMAMRDAGFTTQEMAQEMKVGRDTVGRWLQDKTVPHPFFVEAWADRTGVDLSWLAGVEVRSVEAPTPTRIAPKDARGTGERAGRRTVTDNKDYGDKPRRIQNPPPKRNGSKRASKRINTHSYQYCRHRYLTQETLRQLVDECEEYLVDHAAWVASSTREAGAVND